jgi:predicted anti-sigma-YlaC factor YlaD
MSCMRMESDGMRYLDGEMSPAERSEFEEHIERCETCRRSLVRFRELQSLTRRVKMKDPTDEFWESYWKSIYRRLERKTAWIFIIVGAAMLIGYELYRTVASFGKITFEKIALVIFIIGALLLLVSIIRERLHQYKVDRYRDIER